MRLPLALLLLTAAWLAPSSARSLRATAPVLNKYTRLCQKAWSDSGAGLARMNCSGFEAVDLDMDSPTDYNRFANSSQEWAFYKAQGKLLIGYISVGTNELFRPDTKQFPPNSYFPQPVQGWPDERWIRLDKWEELKPLMTQRLQRVRALCGQSYAACGYEGDNIAVIEGERYNKLKVGSASYNAALANNTAYATWLANTAHAMGLIAVFKNGGGILSGPMAPLYDACIAESAIQYDELDSYGGFLKLGKPLWDFEYSDGGGYASVALVQAAIKKEGFNTSATSIQWDSGMNTAKVHGYITVGVFAPLPIGV